MNLRYVFGYAAMLTLNFWMPAFAGRPLTVDDAEPVALQRFQFETGVGFIGNHSVEHVDLPFALSYGVAPRLQVAVGFGGQIEEREETLGREEGVADFGDLTLSAKGKVLTADRWWADHGLTFTVKFPTASGDKGMGSGTTDFDLTWIVSKRISEKWSAHLNAG